ncbi:MAG: type II toxin-antitoxin system PemK/MazF family toxin [Nitrospirae bacterium]|nr:type II toxin-antitoxin system PemK/MazF family toxin [Nitrospirota bacterium]
MRIRQGDLYWIEFGDSEGSAPGYRHPHVVVQNNVFNDSRLNTVVVCAITSNLKRAEAPGNVMLKKGDGGLKKDSVVNITQLMTVDKADLAEKIGTLAQGKVNQIINGIELLLEPKEVSV